MDEEKVIYHGATLHNVACPCIILYGTKIPISTPAGGARSEMLKLLWTDFSVSKEKKKKIHFCFSPRAATWVYVERFRDEYGCNSNSRNLRVLGKLDSFEWSLTLRCSKCVMDLWWMHMEKNSPAVNKNLPITIYLHPHFCKNNHCNLWETEPKRNNHKTKYSLNARRSFSNQSSCYKSPLHDNELLKIIASLWSRFGEFPSWNTEHHPGYLASGEM